MADTDTDTFGSGETVGDFAENPLLRNPNTIHQKIIVDHNGDLTMPALRSTLPNHPESDKAAALAEIFEDWYAQEKLTPTQNCLIFKQSAGQKNLQELRNAILSVFPDSSPAGPNNQGLVLPIKNLEKTFLDKLSFISESQKPSLIVTHFNVKAGAGRENSQEIASTAGLDEAKKAFLKKMSDASPKKKGRAIECSFSDAKQAQDFAQQGTAIMGKESILGNGIKRYVIITAFEKAFPGVEIPGQSGGKDGPGAA